MLGCGWPKKREASLGFELMVEKKETECVECVRGVCAWSVCEHGNQKKVNVKELSTCLLSPTLGF